MRKIYSFVLALAACIFATNIYAAISITINIDDINRVTVGQYNSSKWDYEAIEGLKSGANALTFDEATTLKVLISNSSEYGVSSVTYVQGTNVGNIEVLQYGTYLNINDSWNGAVFTIKSYSFDDLRTASCKIYVDDASKVSVSRSSYAGIALENGVNVVKFIPDGNNKETPFTIRGTGSLYKVKLNGVEQEASYGSYYLTPANGDSITVLADYPDIDIPVHFIAGNEASKDFITEVTVNDVDVTNWADDNFTVKLGCTVGYKGNIVDYQFDSLFVGTTKNTYFYGNASFFVGSETEDYTVKYYAHKYASYEITINIDNPAAVSAYKYNNEYFSSSSATEIALVTGANKVAFNEQSKYLFVKTNAGCQVLTFTDGAGTDLTTNVDGNYPKGIATTADAVYTITTKTVERTSQLAFYIDDPAKAQYGGGLTFAADNYSNMSQPLVWKNATGASVQAQNGYNIVKFDTDFDNPVQVSFYGPDANTIFFYINDVKQDASTSFSGIRLADGDVLKAYLAAEPQTYTVTFAAKEGTNYGFADVVRDVIVPVEDVTAPLSVLTGTKIAFKLTGATVATANGKALAADADGVYSLDINENTTILAGDEATSIENAQTALGNNVYSLQGVLLLRDATEAQIKALPAGTYIINGKAAYLLRH